ncbi:MAG: heavy metal translocating P-type ATPase [Planctomycetota bacterium]|nr:MAG: heavy metal translocating P-type ATPase [Planctomycetota bacterium]
MDCAEEIATLREQLAALDGLKSLNFDLLQRRMTVELDPGGTSPEGVLAAVARTGMTAEPWEERGTEEGSTDSGRLRRAWTTAASGFLLALGFSTHVAGAGWRAAIGGEEGTGAPLVARCAFLASTVLGAWFVAPKAWLALRRARLDMNLLMCVAILGAIGIGEWFEAATVAFLFAVSLALESWSIGRARKAIAALMTLSPSRARVLGPGNNEELVDAASVAVGAFVVVKPGEKFPLDGRIVRGRTTVNQAPITGESVPVLKEEGSEVFAGTVNEESAVEVRTVKPFADSTLSQIAKMVGEAHARRSPSEQWVERFARIYTPTVMAAAVLLAVVPPLLGGLWEKWFYQALVLLVIACPCALVIATPVSVVAALAAAARQGVLVKGGAYLEAPARLVAIALDKTGTLTEGRPRVSAVVPRAGHDEAELLAIAAAVEMRSTHPLARAIVEHAAQKGIRPVPATDFQMLPGKGAHARIEGVDHWLGSHRYLDERGQESEEIHRELEALASSGSSVVVVGREEHICGYVALADRLRDGAAASIQKLRRAGIERVVMLSGDNRGTAERVAREAGIDEVRAELLPQDKVQAIEELVAEHGRVAMVGDGVNDAPALARSSLGIAMGAAGTDAALETADVALMGDDLSHVSWLIGHSRRTVRVIRQNVIVSLAVKAVFFVLAFAGFASLWGAIAADMGVSLLVVLNALRLLQPSRTSED